MLLRCGVSCTEIRFAQVLGTVAKKCPAARKVSTSAASVAWWRIAKQLAQLNFMDLVEATGTKLSGQRHLCWGRDNLAWFSIQTSHLTASSAVSWHAWAELPQPMVISNLEASNRAKKIHINPHHWVANPYQVFWCAVTVFWQISRSSMRGRGDVPMVEGPSLFWAWGTQLTEKVTHLFLLSLINVVGRKIPPLKTQLLKWDWFTQKLIQPHQLKFPGLIN